MSGPSLTCSRSPSTAWARKRTPAEKSPAFSAAIPTSRAATGSSTSCRRTRATRSRTDAPVMSGSASAMTASTRGSSLGMPILVAASTRNWRVLVRVRVHQQRCAIGTSERSAISGSPPSRICSAIVTKVRAAPDSYQTFPLTICFSHARRAASRGPRSRNSASCSSRRTRSASPSS